MNERREGYTLLPAPVRNAESRAPHNGPVYHNHFSSSDLEGSSSEVVKVNVPHSAKKTAVDGGELYDSTQ